MRPEAGDARALTLTREPSENSYGQLDALPDLWQHVQAHPRGLDSRGVVLNIRPCESSAPHIERLLAAIKACEFVILL